MGMPIKLALVTVFVLFSSKAFADPCEAGKAICSLHSHEFNHAPIVIVIPSPPMHMHYHAYHFHHFGHGGHASHHGHHCKGK